MKGGKVWYVTMAVFAEKGATAEQVEQAVGKAYLEGMVVANVTVEEGVVLPVVPEPKPKAAGENWTKTDD